MKKFIAGVLITLALVFIIRSCSEDKKDKSILQENSMLIQQELKNVSKLIVSEGHFVEVYNYKDSRELFGSLVTADKKALVVANAEVTIAYNLSKISYEMDEANKTITITQIPDAEIKINPDFEYYDVTADYLNPFSAEDYNLIKKNVNQSLLKKIEASTLVSNAQNRLVSELSRIYVLTNSLGWTLIYGDNSIDSTEQLLDLRKTVVD